MFERFARKEIQFGNEKIILETGKIARQATKAVMAIMGETMVLCSVVATKKPKEGVDFFPLGVHYQEKFYAGGRIPGGFFKREARPTERETLISRLIDRPIRPLFPEGFHNEVQVICTLVSYDPKHQPDIVALIGVSAALTLSGVPFKGPVGAARVGYVNGEFVLNLDAEETNANSSLDLVVAGTKDAVLMVESEANQLSEEIMLEAVMFGHKAFQSVIEGVEQMAKEAGNEPWEVELKNKAELIAKVEKLVGADVAKAYKITAKQERSSKLDELKVKVISSICVDETISENEAVSAFKALQANVVRSQILDDKLRIDGRGPADIRQIESELDLLPRTHGSALFTRGETQALAVTTLGAGDDMQMIDDIEGQGKQRFMLHYNFPPYSVGECGAMRAPGRREIGHGKLAYRALKALLPAEDKFPYVIRIVSEITESNGSSSMATVCGASMSMMSAGVPMEAPVAGIAMGLIKEGEKFAVLSDIMGDEDHLGDMDFKVAGTEKGITALQMDIKIDGITEEIMKIALEQAKAGRAHILGEMSKAITASRENLSGLAPQIKTIQIPKEKIGELIGPGGKMIKSIIEEAGVKIDISDDGKVNVAATSGESMDLAVKLIGDVVAVAEIGKIYEGKVVRVVDFGAFVAIMRNTEGLVHVSEMANTKVGHPRDVVKEGQQVTVKVLDIDKVGKIRLSMKAVHENSEDKKSLDDDTSSSNQEVSVESDAQTDQDTKQTGERSERGERRDRDKKKKDRSRDSKPRSNNERSHSDDAPSSSSGKKRRFF
jgi:polyribonucleotide nucleotidyltransferase